MEKHRKPLRRSDRILRLLICVVLLVALGAAKAKAEGDAPVAVRLSYVSGVVRVLDGSSTGFAQAVANMPLLEGYRVETANDGQAEIEFDDGSVARLTPNSSLQLTRLHPANGRSLHTEVEQRSGLVYFELNVTEGQHYVVRFAGATARPTDNSIFRINLDHAPELAVLEGAVDVDGGGAFTQDVARNQSIRLNSSHNAGPYSLTDGVAPDTWDRWNSDRDQEIAVMSQDQTQARDAAGDANQPGWNDLDAYGNWYPVEGYGNVWAPAGVGPQWDPYGYGYWANYPGWGYTWISGYPWGWLPYQCGAWNYFDTFGWGWIPGQCGLGWSPVLTVWNAPPGYHPPPRPIPGGHIGGGAGGHLVQVDRGPAAHGPLQQRGWRDVQALRTTPVHLDGRTVMPLPRSPHPLPESGNTLAVGPRGVWGPGSAHVGVPVRPSTPQPALVRGNETPWPAPVARTPAPIFVRPSSPAPRPMPMPAQPRMPAPSPAPMPRVASPPPAPPAGVPRGR